MNKKSDFLQKAHLQKQMGGESGDGMSGSNLSPHLTQSITRLIEQCEQKARQQSPAENGAKPPLTELDVQVGQPLPTVQRLLRGDDPEESTKYLERLLKLDGKPVASPSTFVKRNIYLLWSIPEQAHQEGLEEKRAQVETLYEKWADSSRKVSELTAKLREYLEGIPEADWTEEKIKQVIKPFMSSIHVTAGEKSTSWGWQFLRWVVSAGTAGPAVIPSMVFLQKEETLARVRQAQQVAERMEL